jgi:ribonuclease M5
VKIKEVIVVEGKDDTAKIKQALDADTIETNGSAINKEILQQISHAKEKRGVIIFTDPDYPGQRIRQIIEEHVPGCKHAFLAKEEALAKGKRGLGIEHASVFAIQSALSKVYELANPLESDITKSDLIAYGLIGSAKSKSRRIELAKHLQIGYVNGKQLLKRLQMFQIEKKELDRVMEIVIQEEMK